MKRKVNPHIGIPLDKYIEDNIGLIYHVVRRFRGFNQDDLFQEAAIQFMKCYERYESGQGRFSTYATTSMRGSIFNYIRNRESILRLPYDVTIIHDLARTNGLDGSDIDKLVKLSGKSKEYVQEAMNNYEGKKMSWLDAERTDGTADNTLHNLLNEIDDHGHVYYIDFLNSLNKRDKTIIDMRVQGYSFSEIGGFLGVSRQAIQARHKKIQAIAKDFYKEDAV